jgi:hypothetical protein
MNKILYISIAAFFLNVPYSALATDTSNSSTQNQAVEKTVKTASTFNLGCITSKELQTKYSPVDLYQAMSQCVKMSQYNEAAFLFAAAGVYGRFDAQRVSDSTAHQAASFLQMQAREEMSIEENKTLDDTLNQTLGTPAGLELTCKEIARVGTPTYYPSYMIQHGMGAFVGSESSDALVIDFDAKTALKNALVSYLECPAASITIADTNLQKTMVRMLAMILAGQ